MTTSHKPHLVIVDGMALLFRSFFATSAMGHYFPNEQGVPTNGVQGFLRHTMSAISLFQPTHLAVCWDMGAHTFRNDLFDGYKANRPAPAPELLPQFDMAREATNLVNWKSYGVVNMEADDVIGSLVETWHKDARITIVSGDKDLLQLLRPNVTIAFTKKGYTTYDTYTEERFVEEFGITPKQFIDKKAFTGDSSDGYPGVKGIGPKTALKLIQEYGSVDGVLEDLQALTPAMRKKIEAEREILLLSRKLAEIRCDLPITDELESLLFEPYNDEIEQRLSSEGYSITVRHAESLFPKQANLPL